MTRNTLHTDERGDGGFTLIEFAMASTLLVVGVMGFVGAIVTSQVMVRATKEMNRANAAVVSIVEEFRRECQEDMDATLTRRVGVTKFKKVANPNGSPGDVQVVVQHTKNEPFHDNTTIYDDLAAGGSTIDAVMMDGTQASNTNYDEGGKAIVTQKLQKVDGTVIRTTKITESNGDWVETFNRDTSTENIAKLTVHTADLTRKTEQLRPKGGVTNTTITTYHYSAPGGAQIVDHGAMDRLGENTEVTVAMLNDETVMDPPVDLNGDGDFLDTEVPPAEMTASILRVHLSWKGVLGVRTLEYTTILARGEMGE